MKLTITWAGLRQFFERDNLGVDMPPEYAEAFDAWRDAELAHAWSEGYRACHQDYQRKTGPMLTPNPHRALEDQ